MSAWSGFLHFIGDLGSWMFGPLESVIPSFRRDIQSLQHYGSRDSQAYLDNMRARAASNVTKYTNKYDNIDNDLQNLKSNVQSARQELAYNNNHNVYTSPVAADVYDVVRNYSGKLKTLGNQLNELSNKLNNATYAQTYYNSKWQDLENKLDRTQGEKDSVLGSAMGLLPLMFE